MPDTSVRLVLVIGSLQAGGAERQLSEMASFWARGGVQVTVATWAGPQVTDFYPLDPAVSRVWLRDRVASAQWTTRAFGTILSILRLRRLLQSTQPHALLSFIDVSNICAIVASLRLPIRVVVAERTHPAINPNVRWLWRTLRRHLYSRADLVVAQTKDAAEWLAHSCGARVGVIPNSLRDLPVPDGRREPLALAIGRLSREKGVDVVLRAFAKVRARFPEWRLCIIGEGDYRNQLLQLRAQLGLTAQVDFIGAENQIERWLSRAGVLVHASRREGFPNVVMEAMAMGLAVVCTDCRAGPSELVDDRVNGRLVPVDDVDALATALSELMGAPELRDAMGSVAMGVRQRYRQDVVMRQWHASLVPQAAILRNDGVTLGS